MGKCAIYAGKKKKQKPAIRKIWPPPWGPRYGLRRHLLSAIINMLKELNETTSEELEECMRMVSYQKDYQ